jgi:hypothetical protein
VVAVSFLFLHQKQLTNVLRLGVIKPFHSCKVAKV